jgi:arsenate reductase
MALTVYGIPTCSTCKKALTWLESHDIRYDWVNTKLNPPQRDTIADWVNTLGAKPLRNTSGQAYRALGEEKKTWTDAQWIEAFTADAMLLKRPVFVKDGTAVLVGFRASEGELTTLLAG